MKKLIIVAFAGLFMQQGIAQIKIDRSKKPKAGAAPVISIKDPAIFNLANGMTVIVVENHKLPKVSATLNIDAGPIKEGTKAGVMDLMGQMLGEGTTNMQKDKFDEAVDGIGADVSLYSSGGSASALSRYFEKAVMLMADGLQHPSFPEDAFKKLQTQTITGLKSSEKSAKAIADRVTTALMYGKNTAMGEFTTEESVKALTLADVKEVYQNYITPSRSYLTFVGDITPVAAKALAEKAFGKWAGKKLELPAVPLAPNPEKTEIDFVDLPTAVQGELSVGNVIYNPLSNPDYHALIVANNILGGGAEAKLFMNLREKHGFTYGSYSNVGNSRFQSLFKAGAAVRTEKVDSAVNEMFKEILNMRDGKVTDEELATVKAKYNGSFALGMENPATAATYASNILINNLPKDFYRTFLQKINAVTIDDVKRVSGKYFNETNSRIVIVGNGKKILPALMRLGFPIKKYDKFAEPVADAPQQVDVKQTATNTDAISAYSVIESYIKAIGGKAEVEKVTSVSSTLTMEAFGRSFEGTDKRMNPNKSVTEVKMGAMTVMKSVFDGTIGYQSQMGKKTDMDLDEVKEAQDEKGVIPQLFYNGANYKTEYVGTGKIGDEATYRLKVVMPSGRTSVQEYSIKTGLLLHEETTSKQQGADIPVIIDYKDYRKVGNIMMPFEITRNAGGQEIPLKFTAIKINEGVSDIDFK
ncbi:MAG: insulinase family protein [Chitinophagaceae bacterium]|nr:insulinase family protein [Chitinophagaceae bacterium]